MDNAEVYAVTAACTYDSPPSCTCACPFGLDLRQFMKKAARPRWSAAANELQTALPFPVMISRLCPHPCEQYCQRHTVLSEEAVAINMIERAVAASPENKDRKMYKPPLSELRAAVIGAGPAGLCAALHLDRKRFNVDVFEKENGPVPGLADREDHGLFLKEIDLKFGNTDVTFHFGHEIGALAPLAGYDAIIIATGKEGPRFGLAPADPSRPYLTADKKTFLCGEAAGYALIDGMARSLAVAKAIEHFLMTGNHDYREEEVPAGGCTSYVPHPDTAPVPHVDPADGSAYTKEEAMAEAARCMRCNCTACMNACEMLQAFNKKPPEIANDVVSDGKASNSVSEHRITRQVWSCNMCGRCAGKCDAGIDLSKLMEISRADRVEQGSAPEAFHGYWMEEMEFFSGEARLIRPAPGKETAKYVYFPGCRLGGADSRFVTEIYPLLLDTLGEVGIMMTCCGIPAHWGGRRERFAGQLEDIRRGWEELGRPQVICGCVSCLGTFRRFLPEIPAVSLMEVLAEQSADVFPARHGSAAPAAASDGTVSAVADGAAPAAFPGGLSYALYDPCVAKNMPGVREAARRLAEKAGISLTDYTSDGKCCGFGGHILPANPGLYGGIAKNRAADTEAPYLTYCVNCGEVFREAGHPAKHLLELLLGIEAQQNATLDEMRENALCAKRGLLETFFKETMEERQNDPWDSLVLSIPDDVLAGMRRQLVRESNVKKCIYINDLTKDGFVDENGDILCRLPDGYITFWVKYRPRDDGSFRILEVYTHRIRIRE